MLLLVALLAAPQVWSVLRGRHTEQMATGYYEASLEQKLQYGCFYLMLLCFLALMSHDVHLLLGHLRGS